MRSIPLLTGARLLLGRFAPDGTRRGRLRQMVTDFLRKPRVREAGPEPLAIYDREALAAALPRGALALPDATAAAAEVDAAGAARFILVLLRDGVDLRRRFPRALSSGADGPFCRWLCTEGASELGLSPQAVGHVQAAFARDSGGRVRRLYAQRPELRRLFPLALVPGGRRRFLHWLLRRGIARHGLLPEDGWWFIYEVAEDTGGALAASYRQQPAWQRAVPDGLGTNLPHLRAWLRQRYHIRSDWLDHVTVPNAAPTKSGALGINILGHFCYPSGLQEQALAAARGAEAAGVAVSLRDVPAGPGKDVLSRSPYLGLEEHGVTVFYLGSEPGIVTCYDLAGLAPRASVHRIAAWSWELEVVPRSWARRARAVDEFWAHTRFIADAARRVLPVPVVHMLPGVELLPFTPLPRARFGLPEERTLFLFAFDMASVLERKNPLGLIRAFREAFTPSDRAALVLKISRGDADPEGLSRLSATAREAGVYLIDRIMPRGECTALFNCCDCYVSLHRSEGFGFTMVEAMLLGKPVVATGYSGNVDFMTPDASLLIPYTLVALERDYGIYPKGARWAEPSISDAAAAMRWVYEHPAEAAALGERGRRHVAEVLSFEVYGRRIQARLAELQRARAAGRV